MINERIQKLILRAGVSTVGTDGQFTMDEFLAFQTKFAELIVKECIDIIEDEGSHEGGSIRSMEKIKQHFGVEE